MCFLPAWRIAHTLMRHVRPITAAITAITTLHLPKAEQQGQAGSEGSGSGGTPLCPRFLRITITGKERGEVGWDGSRLLFMRLGTVTCRSDGIHPLPHSWCTCLKQSSSRL